MASTRTKSYTPGVPKGYINSIAEPGKIDTGKSNVNLDLQFAFNLMTNKRYMYDELYRYYRGNHPLRYSTERLRKAFDKIGVYFAQNWLAVVIDALLDRLVLKGFDINNKSSDVDVDKLWEDYRMQLMADDVHEAASVLGEAYVIAWREENDSGEIVTDVYYNDPRMCQMVYDPYRPTEKMFASKMWIGSDRHPRMILYYVDRIEHYISQSRVAALDGWITSAGSFQPDPAYGPADNIGIEPNDYGVIPVFHFRVGRVSGKRELGQSEISLQDAINKLMADMMVASEFTTFSQRAIISQADPGDLKNNPGTNWWIPAGDGKSQAAQVLELGNKSLENYLHGIEHLAQSMAIISRTPKHYLMLEGREPSGDALLAMEAPLNKKAKKRQESYAVEWTSLIQFLLMLDGKKIDVKDITPIWEPIETQQPTATATQMKDEIAAGLPLVTVLRRMGWGKDEIDQMLQDRDEEKKKATSLAQNALAELRAQDAKTNMNSDGTMTTAMGGSVAQVAGPSGGKVLPQNPNATGA